jgi:hypothetical protein
MSERVSVIDGLQTFDEFARDLIASLITRRVSRVACAFLVYTLPPLPRCSGWAYSSLISPRRVSLPLFLALFHAPARKM